MDSGLREDRKIPFLGVVQNLRKKGNILLLLGFIYMCLLIFAIYLAVYTSYSYFTTILTIIIIFNFAGMLYARKHLKWGN